MEFHGTIIEVKPVKNGFTKNKKEWRKQDCVLSIDNGKRKLLFTFWNNDIETYAEFFKIGANIVLHAHVESREHNGYLNTNVTGYKVEYLKLS